MTGVTPWASLRISKLVRENVLNEVFLETGVHPRELMSESRVHRIAHARQYAMWKLRQMRNGDQPRYSTLEIGRAFHKDHTTVLWAIAQHEARLASGHLVEAA